MSGEAREKMVRNMVQAYEVYQVKCTSREEEVR
jgi:hypothetical protein